MQNIIDETEKKAYVFLKEFGFEENEIIPVVTKGLYELENILEKLKDFLSSCQEYDIEAVDDLLHALKGLLFQLGNHALAEEVETLRGYEDTQIICHELQRILL